MNPYPQDVIPDGRSSKIHVEIRVAAACTHQAVALNLRTHELYVFNWNIRRPVVADPTQLIHNSRWGNYLTQSAVIS